MGKLGLPGGEFRELAADRKVELTAHIYDQLGVEARSIWAQGAFDYQDATEDHPHFSGFYSVWELDGAIEARKGVWLDAAAVADAPIPTSLRVLLTSLLDTRAMRTR